MLGERSLKFMATALALAIAAIALFLAAEGPIRLGLLIYPEQLIALILGFSLGLSFLLNSSGLGPRKRIPLHDLVFSLAGIGVGIHLALRYPVLSQEFFFHPTETLVVGVLLVPLLVEALRRTTGLGLVVVVLAFIAYALVADYVPGTLQGRASPLTQLLPFLAIDGTAIFGSPLMIVGTIVIIYIFFGALLTATGGSAWFTDLAIALVGRSRGGSAKIAVVASAFFGSISGSAVANVASTGVITIPLMKKAGFSPRNAAAFEAVASTGGQIMPPVMGAAAFLMAEFLQVSYGAVVVAAAVPALLFFIAVLIQADLEAGRRDIPPVAEDLIKPVRTVLKAGWYFPIPFAVLIVGLFGLNMSPAQAALWSAVAIIALNLCFGYEGKRIDLGAFYRAILTTGRGSVEIVIVGAAAGVVVGILETTGLSFGLTFLLIQFGSGSLFLLLFLTAVICILLGMGMPTTGIYLLVATLAAPPLVELGVDPMAAHLFILYFGLMSMISPPVAVAAFTAASIARARPLETAVTSMRIGWPAFVIPFLFVYSPSLLLRGGPVSSVVAVVTAILGVWLVSAGVIGFLRRRLGPVERAVFGVSGLVLLVPGDMFPGALWLNLAGAVGAALAFAALIGLARQAVPAAAVSAGTEEVACGPGARGE